MEKQTRQNQEGKTKVCNSSNPSNTSYSVACSYRTLFVTKGWSVIPILNNMQKVMGDMLANADLSYYSERVNK